MKQSAWAMRNIYLAYRPEERARYVASLNDEEREALELELSK